MTDELTDTNAEIIEVTDPAYSTDDLIDDE